MDHASIVSQSQDLVHVQSKIDDFFCRFKIATLMHRCGVRKHHGHSVRSLTKAISTLLFVGKNFFRGIVLNSALPFGMDAAYELLKGGTYNWRRLLLALGLRLFGVFNRMEPVVCQWILLFYLPQIPKSACTTAKRAWINAAAHTSAEKRLPNRPPRILRPW